ncbi:acyl-CoA dehydrogenase [Phenylobacterium sp. LjRoot225]|uniref:acyl-CoA dehydrogenase family protein n=1 Tax=Phenylobacterium sp. LjRoot225 TaxID=3342285 RepID=UPI003ED09E00
MDFELSEEQRLLADMVGGYVRDRYGFEARAHALRDSLGFSRAVWRDIAELGLLGVAFPEEDGGFGGGGVEMMIVMEAFGRGLVVEPYLATVVMAGGLLRRAASPAQKAARIPQIVAGERIMTLAHQEAQGPRHTVEKLRTTAVRAPDGWVLKGAKVSVLAGAAADELIVSARTAEGVSLFLLDPGLAGVTVRRREGFDGIALADLHLADVALPAEALMGRAGEGAELLARVFEEANAALCAEAVGVMSEMLEMTTEYLKTRTQFGFAIGGFQALQHRAVEMLMQTELSRSMAILAALSLERGPEERWRNVAAAKAKIGAGGRYVGQQAVQLHGAIGLTAEYKIGHAFKRLTAIELMFGDADHHLDALAEAGGLVPLS